jgi:assimilatory nitrate reductase catalytic subunit
MVLTARGAEQHSRGTDTAQAFVNLALALGLPGRTASGYGTITGQGNGQGGREHGQRCNQLPGGRDINKPEHRQFIADFWIDPDELPKPGLSAFEMLDWMSARRVRALILMASNVVVSAPDVDRVRRRLGASTSWSSRHLLSETAEWPTSSSLRPSGPRRRAT